jgi:hypothetical protein
MYYYHNLPVPLLPFTPELLLVTVDASSVTKGQAIQRKHACLSLVLEGQGPDRQLGRKSPYMGSSCLRTGGSQRRAGLRVGRGCRAPRTGISNQSGLPSKIGLKRKPSVHGLCDPVGINLWCGVELLRWESLRVGLRLSVSTLCDLLLW